MYISIDAATRDALKAVDRPLFPDFWERFLRSIDSLAQKDLSQRTVFRMTLGEFSFSLFFFPFPNKTKTNHHHHHFSTPMAVKQWNMDMKEECERYANLIQRGQPDFIEIKSVTFCGVSDGSNLTMKNVPWYEEVRSTAECPPFFFHTVCIRDLLVLYAALRLQPLRSSLFSLFVLSFCLFFLSGCQICGSHMFIFTRTVRNCLCAQTFLLSINCQQKILHENQSNRKHGR